jgi:nucleotide-binding universal stress UspA family protein
MLTIRRILLPTDYSACAEGAFTHAAYLADRYGAELHVLHVTEPDGEGLESCFDDLRITPEDIAADLKLPLPERDDRPADEPVALVEHEETGPDPAPVILRYIDEHDIDLVVMGTHGRRGLRRMMLGSVTEEVLRLSPCPVFTVRRPQDETDLWTVDRVLAAVDLSERSIFAARHAAGLAATYDARLTLALVLDTVMMPTSVLPESEPIDFEDLQRRAEKDLADLANQLQDEVPALRDRVEIRVEVGHPVRDIVDMIEDAGVDRRRALPDGEHRRAAHPCGSVPGVHDQELRQGPHRAPRDAARGPARAARRGLDPARGVRSHSSKPSLP